MGLNVGFVNSANYQKPVIDVQALAKVTEKILNPNNDKTIDVSKLDLSKFNRASLGTDLYAQRTSGELALKASKAAVDFNINLSQAFSANVQYLNSQAAQSLFTSKENMGKLAVGVDEINQIIDREVITQAAQVTETYNLDKDKKGSNPFSFYMHMENKDSQDKEEPMTGSINIFA